MQLLDSVSPISEAGAVGCNEHWDKQLPQQPAGHSNLDFPPPVRIPGTGSPGSSSSWSFQDPEPTTHSQTPSDIPASPADTPGLAAEVPEGGGESQDR